MNTSLGLPGRTLTHWPALSVRERAVLLLIGQGFPDKEIAAALRIMRATAITHKNNGFAKLGLTGRRDLFQFVVRYPHLFLPEADTPTAGD
ncbi:MAG: helix-turn-helix transcriptional regulator [Rudanella sp.]|nr:helix-turn-helix transcriptional regulator [Rudanella sp.]